MKIVAAAWVGGMLAAGALAADEVLIPAPLEREAGEGAWSAKEGVIVTVAAEGEKWWADELARAAGLDFEVAVAGEGEARAGIRFVGPEAAPPTVRERLSGEAFWLEVDADGARVAAADAAGRFYGMQALRQMLAAAPRAVDGAREMSAARVFDEPRFAYRGLLIDEASHFLGVEEMKRWLDAMAAYRLNHLHWHLTGSDGWRIEIPRRPELTEIGAVGNAGDEKAPAAFYRAEEVREILAYAAARHITVIPEIALPARADAVVRAYPELNGGGYRGRNGFTVNPAKEQTMALQRDVLAAMRDLFPDAPMIHLGGDVVHFGWHQWPELPEVAALMKAENLADLRAVEAWFARGWHGMARDAGFATTAAWDEAAACGLPAESAVVFWWRHDRRAALEAALADGHRVVLTPRLPTYLDFAQHMGQSGGRRWAGEIADWRAIHGFPESTGITPGDGIIGIQAALWTKEMPTLEARGAMAWPRLLAFAEAAWSTPERKDADAFSERMAAHLEWVKRVGFAVFEPEPTPVDAP